MCTKLPVEEIIAFWYVVAREKYIVGVRDPTVL